MTKNQSDINYIGKIDAEWVDPRVELPPETGDYLVRYLDRYIYAHFSVSLIEQCMWRTANKVLVSSNVAAWLRIGGPSTAIPREKVQAAVDEIAGEAMGYKAEHMRLRKGDAPTRALTNPVRALYRGTFAGLEGALEILRDHTGVTPTEVHHDQKPE